MERTSVLEVYEETLRNVNEKFDGMWNYIKEMREETNKQSELLKKQSERMARIEMKLDTVLLKNIDEKAAMDAKDDSITNAVVSLHSRDAATEVKEDGGDIEDLVVQNENSCTEADGIIEVEEVHVQGLEVRAPGDVMKRKKRATAEELKNLFWWLVDTGFERWPLGCIVCGVKLHPTLKQVEDHVKGKVHRNGVLSCNDFKKLKRYVAAERLRLAAELVGFFPI